MSLHSVDLHHVSYHDVTDSWKILFLDEHLEPFEEERLVSIKSRLEQAIRSISFSEEGVAYSEDFTLSVEDDKLITEEQYNFPEDATFQELVEKTQDAILLFAQKESINVLLEILLNGTEYGNSFYHYFHAASIFGQTSSADVKVYEDVDEERLYWDIDHEDDTNNEYILEALSDNLDDNFDETPFECDDDGDLTEDGETLRDKFYELTESIFTELSSGEPRDDDDECDECVIEDDDESDDDDEASIDIETLDYTIPEGLNTDAVDGYKNAYLVIIHAFVNDGWKYDPSKEYDPSSDNYNLTKTSDGIRFSVSISDAESVENGSIEVWVNLENDNYDEQTQLHIAFCDEETDQLLPLNEVFKNANETISDINHWLVEDFIENSKCNDDDEDECDECVIEDDDENDDDDE